MARFQRCFRRGKDSIKLPFKARGVLVQDGEEPFSQKGEEKPRVVL